MSNSTTENSLNNQKSFSGYGIIQFFLVFFLVKNYTFRLESIYSLIETGEELLVSETGVFGVIITFIFWVIFAVVFDVFMAALEISNYLTFKAKIFYLLSLALVLLVFSSDSFIYPIANFVFGFSKGGFLSYLMYLLIFGPIMVIPFIVNNFIMLLTIKPLKSLFYTGKSITINQSIDDIIDNANELDKEYGDLSIPFFEELSINESTDIPNEHKDIIGFAFAFENNDVMGLNYEMLRKNPASFEKYFLEVNNETREELLKSHIDFYDNEILKLDFYKNNDVFKETLAPEELRDYLLEDLHSQNGVENFRKLGDILNPLVAHMRRWQNLCLLAEHAAVNLRKRLDQDYKGIKIGNDGERLVNNELARRSFNVHNLPGVNIFNNGFNVEYDNILISKRGIFVLEVKNVGSNRNRNHTIKVSRDGRFQYFKDGREQEISGRTPIQQNNEHRDTLMGYIYQVTGKEYPIIPFVVYANDNIHIENDSNHMIMRTNMILTQHDLYPEIMSEEEVKLIKDLLVSASGEDKKFEVFDYILFAKDNLIHLLNENPISMQIEDANYKALDICRSIASITDGNVVH